MWKTEATRALPGLRLCSHSRHGNRGTKGCQKARSETHSSTPSIGGLTAGRVYAGMRRYFKAFGEDPRDLAIRLYACVLVLLSGGLVLGLVLTKGFGQNRSLWPLLAFALLAIMAERQSVRFTENIELSVAFLPLLFVAVVFGPLAAAAIGAVTVLPDLGRPYTRWIIWTANRTIIGGMAGLAALIPSPTGRTVGPILAATFLAASADFAPASGSLTCAQGRSAAPSMEVCAGATVIPIRSQPRASSRDGATSDGCSGTASRSRNATPPIPTSAGSRPTLSCRASTPSRGRASG